MLFLPKKIFMKTLMGVLNEINVQIKELCYEVLFAG
jgi:hypothetical protein